MSRQTRDRRGRGLRGPAFGLPSGPSDPAPDGVPAKRTRAQRFDAIAVSAMQDLWGRFPEELGMVQLGVEEVPLLPENWSPDSIPLASYVEASGSAPARVVLLRRPIEHRAQGPVELEALILTVLVEQVAEVLGLRPQEVHPDYDAED
ncbi:metallopeptidase family protein [Nocardioides terrisoli]|uniref:metallopeptidase family protein n=1 Tax=Nocardioides terrisoli TaxID=3388267 RepID=UPI00287B8903|nr:metallopeptidase family protein [Nocardioides marmorisolisilvae]